MAFTTQVVPRPSGEVQDQIVSAWIDDTMRYLNDLNIKLKQIPLVNSQSVSITDTGTVNTNFTVNHNLNRIPVGYIVSKINKAGVVYTGSTTWTDKAIYLKCSVANCSVTVVVF